MRSVKLKLAVQNSIYSKVVNNKAKNKMHIDTEYEREKMAAALTLTSSRYQVLGL